MVTKTCKKCGRKYYGAQSSRYCSVKCGRNKNYYKNKDKIIKRQREYRRLHPEKHKEADHKYYLKNKKTIARRVREWEEANPKRKEKIKKKANLKFRTEKREHFNQLIMKNYYNNKGKWLERGYVDTHRKELLKLLPKKCANCGKKSIKIISHITYNVPKRKKTGVKREELEKYLIEYAKTLRPFCSLKCHNKYNKKK